MICKYDDHTEVVEGEMFPDGKRTFKVGDKVQTRDGRPARIICDDLKVGGSLAVVVTTDLGVEVPCHYNACGQLWPEQGPTLCDLVPLPLKHTVWVNLWPETGHTVKHSIHENPRWAQSAKADGALACIRVEIEEGKFDGD